MSGIGEAEAILGLISAIISIIDAAKQVYDAAQDAMGLPEAFREVAQRLPLVRDTLLTVKREADARHWDANRSAAVKKTLEGSQTKSIKLEKIFKDVIRGDTASRLDRYVAAARTLGKGSRVETLMKGILDDMSLVAGNQVAGLSEAIVTISGLKPSLTSEQLPEQDAAYSHSGSGDINHVEGNQYNNQGSGKQYNFGTVNTLNLVFSGSDKSSCLHSLRFPEMNYRNIELLNDISPATCDWILRNTLYREWKSANSGVLWIKGNPGTGKSTLLAFVFQEFANEIKNDATQSDQLVLSFFFHARGTILQKTRLGMFRTLLFQLLKAVPQPCTPLLEDFVERQESVLSGERVDWHENELGIFLKKILSTPGFPRRVIMFVDALDEAGKQVANELIEYFHELLELATSRGVKLKICFSSRPYPILIGVSSVASIVVQDQNNEGIVQYIQNFLQKLSPDDTVKKHKVVKEFEELIVTNAKGVFQWARLVLERLAEADRERESLARLRTLLREIPQDLYKMYHHLLTEILGEKKHQIETILLFQWVCFADHPLSIDELCQAMAFDDEYFSFEHGSNFSYLEADRADFEVRIKVWSAGLIEVKQHFEKTTIQIIHQSVGDFLREGGGLQTLLPTFGSMMKLMGESHARLTRACLNYLRQPHIESMANQIESFYHQAQTREGVNVVDDHHFLEYVRDCWYIHAREAEKCCHVQLDLVERLGFPGKKTSSLFGLKHSFREGRVFRTWLAIYREYAIQRRLDFYISIAFAGTTLVHLAASQNLHSIIDELERRGVSVTERDATGQTALHYAARGGHILMVKRLLRRSFGSSLDVDAEGNAADALSFNPPLSYDTRTPQGVTALMIAVWNNHTEIIKLLLQKNPKIKLYNRLKYLDLERRPARPATRRIEATAEILIADRDEFQGQNLLYAVLSDDAYAVGALINQGAIVNMIGRFNEVSPLHGAALIGSLDIVNLLVDAGAELDISCAAVPNPTDWSFLSAKESLHAVHENLKLRQTLEAEMNVPIVTGLTPLRIAAEKGYRRIVERLLAAGADVNTPVTRPGLTALEAAAAKGHSEIVKILLDAGAHVELMLEDGTLMSNLESIMSGGRLVLASAALNDCQAPLVISSNLKRRDPALVYRLLKTKKVEPIGLFKESIEARHRLAIEETEARLQRLFVMYEKGRFFRMPSDE